LQEQNNKEIGGKGQQNRFFNSWTVIKMARMEKARLNPMDLNENGKNYSWENSDTQRNKVLRKDEKNNSDDFERPGTGVEDSVFW